MNTGVRTVDMYIRKSTVTSKLNMMVYKIPLAIFLTLLGIAMLPTIILIPGSALCFFLVARLFLGMPEKATCPYCSKTFNVDPGTPGKNCPACDKRIVFNWIR